MPDLSSIEAIFRENFSSRSELGAAVSIWKDGEEILSLAEGVRSKDEGHPWTVDTLAPVWSATKGPAAVTLLVALDEAGISPGSPVSRLWPELRAARDGLTILQLLSHQVGLAAMSPDNRPTILNHTAVRKGLEIQEPLWEPGTAHGYHPRTIGFLVDELVRRCTGGKTLSSYWREKIAEPARIDFWIGDLPYSAMERIALMTPPRIQRPPTEEIPFYRSLTDADSLSHAAFASPGGMKAISDINRPEFLQAGIPSLGGVGSATALSAFYQILAGDGTWNGVRVIPRSVLSLLKQPVTSGMDLTLLLETAFSAGTMMDPVSEDGAKLRTIFGPGTQSFGHPGAGGSHAFADPERRLSFAYVMNQMEAGLLPNRKSLDMVEELYRIFP